MAGFLALGNDQYIGHIKANEDNGIENGTFVTVDFANGVAAYPADDTAADAQVYFVENDIDTVVEEAIDDDAYVVKKGKYLRLKVPQKGEVFVTTKFTGATTPAVDDIVAVGGGGSLKAIGTRTPAVKFVVLEQTTAYGAAALKVMVL